MNDLINKINGLCLQFKADADRNIRGNKTAGVRARKVSLEISKLMKDYRKMSIESNK